MVSSSKTLILLFRPKAVLQQFKSDPQSVLDRLEETRQAVLRPDKAEIYLAGDIEKLTYTYGATLVTEASVHVQCPVPMFMFMLCFYNIRLPLSFCLFLP